jgi:hypothetical protein
MASFQIKNTKNKDCKCRLCDKFIDRNTDAIYIEGLLLSNFTGTVFFHTECFHDSLQEMEDNMEKEMLDEYNNKTKHLYTKEPISY